LDESSHVLNAEAYTSGRTEWDAAVAGLMADTQQLWFSWYHDGTYIEPDGKGDPDYVSYVMALEDYCPEAFTETFFGEKPEGAETLEGDPITLCLPEMGIWLYFSTILLGCIFTTPARSIKILPQGRSDGLIFDTVHAWLEAESRGDQSGRV
ncbi:MAG: hypothetical protein ACLSB9_32240, partial [Hydrogeniiclostridium mannosilyticum]